MRKKEEKMRKKTLFIFLFILVSAGCATLGHKQIPMQSKGPTAVVTRSWVNGGIICREHDPETGLIVNSTFFDGAKCVSGTSVDVWVCDGEITVDSDPESSQDPECRQRTLSSELFGWTNPPYNCGGWGCDFWP